MKETRKRELCIALATAMGASITLSLVAGHASAQQQTAQTKERIEVTGSNIKRVDTETVAPVEYNYRTKAELARAGVPIDDWEQPFDLHGLSVFLRDGDRVFHTYSAYARGVDNLGFISNFLDLTPLGRQEQWEEPQGRAVALGASAGSPAVRYHDEY